MERSPPLNWGQIFRTGIIAGIGGGILIDVFLGCTVWFAMHTPITAVWLYVASAVDKNAMQHPADVWLGLFIHFIVSIAWGIGYAYVAFTRDTVMKSPLISGLVFGFVVYIVMTIVQMAGGMPVRLDTLSIVSGLIAHCVFFGLPVALLTSKLATSAQTN